MSDYISKLNDLLSQQVLEDGFTPLCIDGVGVFRATQTHECMPAFYEPMICLIGQGAKNCHVGDSIFRYQSGNFFINFLPMPVITEVMAANRDQPFLSATLSINLVRLADMVLRIERTESGETRSNLLRCSGAGRRRTDRCLYSFVVLC